jgi:Ca2+:H+ antiporter
VPSAFSRFFTAEAVVPEEKTLNLVTALVLLGAYGAYLVFLLKTHPDFFRSSRGKDEGHQNTHAQWSVARSVGSLLGASALAAWMSEILVGAAQGTGEALGMSQAFIGVVLLAVVGGAAESGSAIAMARKNKLDLTIGIAMGSSIQIALFVAPVLVLASYFVGPGPMELAFSRAEVGTLLPGRADRRDGRGRWAVELVQGVPAHHGVRDDRRALLFRSRSLEGTVGGLNA